MKEGIGSTVIRYLHYFSRSLMLYESELRLFWMYIANSRVTNKNVFKQCVLDMLRGRKSGTI